MPRPKNKKIPIPIYLTRSPSGFENGYIRLTPSLTASDAYKSLTPLAVVMYIDMLMRARGHDTIIYTQRMAFESRKISKTAYTDAIKQLTRVGLIVRLPRSCYAPSTYRFSVEWKNFSISPDCFSVDDVDCKSVNNKQQAQ